ncbi:unnamed protein product [Medioppia subpectinata]|uniref:HP domain-containing protein n=1 Tax=Medioppia subpectinata TaxID=1979941 RepID=A0A7R9KMN2_9ACAR|nr:unnamed protein product [Medioppia subpectinata]CAG2105359.1 unnamed protein product [Medioppia subpectinata]
MFYVRGVVPNEATLVEVETRAQSLRSRTAFAFINASVHTIYVWIGCKCLDQTREVMQKAIENLINHKSCELSLKADVNYVTKEFAEGSEGKEFWDVFGSHGLPTKRLYYSSVDSPLTFDYTPRLFHMTSSSGEFTAKEILCSYRSGHNVTPYPFTQEDVYSAQQPTFFLLDNHNQIFLWESKYGFGKDVTEDTEANAATGSQNIRWNAERKCALDSALAYCFAKNSAEPPNGFVVCAGLEPDSFCGLFPQWMYREDVADLHKQDGRKPGEMLAIQEVLSQYRSQYSLEELRRRPLPEGLNALCLESYLGVEEFQEALGMSREDFYCLPVWRQTHLKQKANLF